VFVDETAAAASSSSSVSPDHLPHLHLCGSEASSSSSVSPYHLPHLHLCGSEASSSSVSPYHLPHLHLCGSEASSSSVSPDHLPHLHLCGSEELSPGERIWALPSRVGIGVAQKGVAVIPVIGDGQVDTSSKTRSMPAVVIDGIALPPRNEIKLLRGGASGVYQTEQKGIVCSGITISGLPWLRSEPAKYEATSASN
jgi:hypothetical protein